MASNIEKRYHKNTHTYNNNNNNFFTVFGQLFEMEACVCSVFSKVEMVLD